MNIFLTSSFAEVVDLFIRFTGGECRGRTVTLIPTASLAEEVNSYLVAAKDALVKAGLVIDELEVSTATQDEIVSKLDSIEVEGVSGGGLVKIRASAKGRIIGVAIDDSLIVPDDKAMLEDLITAAFNDARGKADAVANEEMAKAQQGMGLPPGFNLPGLG